MLDGIINGIGTTSQFSNARIITFTRNSSDPADVNTVSRRVIAP